MNDSHSLNAPVGTAVLLLDRIPVPETLPVPGSGSAVPGCTAEVPGKDTPVPPPELPECAPETGSSGLEADPTGAVSKLNELTGWKIAAAAVVVLLALGVFAYGAAGSYDSVWHLAADHNVPLPKLVPIGVDGGLILAVLTDIVLTWIGQPLWWLRAAARGFVTGSVAANAAAGWPDPIAVFLHCFPPVIVLLVTEAGRAAMLRKHAEADGRDPIPLARWLAAPLSTAAMWRRMALWGVKSYAMAVTAEVTRRQAIMQLQERYGRRWRKHAPTDLVWLLRTGNRLGEACARAKALVASDDGTGTGENKETGTGRGRKPGTGNRNPRTRNPKLDGNRRSRTGNPSRGTGTSGSRTRKRMPRNRASAGLDAALVEDVRRRMAEHREKEGRNLTVAELAIAIGRRKTFAGDLMRAARAQGSPDGRAVEARR